MINYDARYEDKKHARELRLLLTANITTSDTMFGVLGDHYSARCKAIRRAAEMLEYAAQYGHISRRKRGAK